MITKDFVLGLVSCQHNTYSRWIVKHIIVFYFLSNSKGSVAIARKMLIVVWHVLTKHEADRNTTSTATERFLMNWSTRHRLTNKVGMKRTSFVHQRMGAFGVQPSAEGPWH